MVDPTLRTAAIRDMQAVHRDLGRLPNQMLRHLAGDIGAGISTLRRWFADHMGADPDQAEDPGDDRPRELTERQIEVVFEASGSLAEAKRRLDDIDPTIAEISYVTFWRLWQRQPPELRAMATGGAKAAINAQVKMLWQAKERNEWWHIDAMEMPVWVLPKGYTTTCVKPWLTSVIDDATRRLMAVGLTIDRPTAESVLVTVADGIRRKDLSNGQWAGGIPDRLHSDNGGEFRSDHLRQALTRLGISHRRTFPYMSHQNGKVERVQQTIQTQFVAHLAGRTHGPLTLRGQDLFGLDGPLYDEQVLFDMLLGWVEIYNSRAHSSLGGASPNEAWCASTRPLTEADPETIRLSMLRANRTYRVQNKGVHFQGRYYMGPGIASEGLVGRDVEVRHIPSDPSFIDLYIDDKWVTTAYPHADLTEAQRREIDQLRRDQYTDARAYLDAAARSRRVEAEANGAVMVATRPNHDAGLLAGDDDAYLELIDGPQDAP